MHKHIEDRKKRGEKLLIGNKMERWREGERNVKFEFSKQRKTKGQGPERIENEKIHKQKREN
jgi:hypothetical protein